MQNLDSRAVSMANAAAGGLTGGLALPYAGIKVPSAAFAAAAAAYHPSMSQAAFEFHRAQLYTDYSVRFHLGMRAYPGHGLSPYHPNPHDPLSHPFFAAKYDPRARFVQEEPKPQQSYIGLIAMAILSSKEKKLVLSDIYQCIWDNYPYFRTRGPGWRNSIRHNLSLNDCFIKAGRSANGKGHYWAIHPANVDDFKKGDFRRRKAQRRVRKAMGLAVPDDDESPSPPPPTSAETIEWRNKMLALEAEERMQQEQAEKQQKGGESSSDEAADKDSVFSPASRLSPRSNPDTSHSHSPVGGGRPIGPFPTCPTGPPSSRKRLFDVESLLAPDDAPAPSKRTLSDSEGHLERSRDSDDDEFIDVDSKVDVENVDDVSEDNNLNNVSRNGSEDLHDDRLERPSSHEGHRRTPSPHYPDSPERREEEKDSRSPPNIPVVMTTREGSNGLRGHWLSPLSVGTSWPDHPSAFHSAAAAAAAANTVTAWSTVPHPAAGFPVTPYPLALSAVPPSAVHAPSSATASPGEALAAQQRWQETFSRIVARVCPEKNVKVEA